MIEFIGTSVTLSLLITINIALSLIYTIYSSPIAHALGFSIITSLILATDLNTETITSNHYEVFLLFRLQLLLLLCHNLYSILTVH
jgi:hypothetical protein